MEPSSRKIVKRSPARTVRLLNLPDLQPTAIECESSLERDFVQVASVFFATRSIKHQPFWISLQNGRYTPDFLVRFQDGSTAVVEVKPKSRIEEHAKKLDEAALRISESDAPFFVIDETAIQLGGMARQARLMRRYAKGLFPAEQCTRVLDVVRESRGITLGNLQLVHGASKPLVLHLISRRQLSCVDRLSTDDSVALVVADLLQKEPSHAIQFGTWLGTTPWKADA